MWPNTTISGDESLGDDSCGDVMFGEDTPLLELSPQLCKSSVDCKIKQVIARSHIELYC